MKKLIITIAALLLTFTAFAQAPGKMSYQAVVRNASNELVANSNIGMQISILQGSPTGNTVYAETQTPVSNDNGLISLQIGNGSIVFGDMNEIDWSAGPYFIQTETDPMGGTYYSIIATNEMTSVPFAMQSTHADTALYAGFAAQADKAFTATTANQAVTAGSAGSATYAEFTDSANLAAFAYSAGNANHAATATTATNASHATNATSATNAVNAQLADSSNVAKYAYDVPTRKRSIMITPGMIGDSYVNENVTHAQLWHTGIYQPVLEFPDAKNSVVAMSIPLPSDYNGGPITAKVLYSSSTSTGNFDCSVFNRGVAVGGNLAANSGGGGLVIPTLSSPSILGEGTTNLALSISSATRYLNIIFKRRGASSADTSTGKLHVLGLIIEYDAK
jgi:hypothetical protein